MAEVAPAGGGGGVNRTFLLIVGGLAALLVIGLLAVGALFVLPSLLPKSPSLAATSMTPTRIAIAPTATATKVPVAVTPTLVLGSQAAATNTPLAAPTQAAADSGTNGTAVAPSAADPASKGGQAEATPAASANGSLPQGGLGENLVLLAVGLVLVVVLFAARRARAVN